MQSVIGEIQSVLTSIALSRAHSTVRRTDISSAVDSPSGKNQGARLKPVQANINMTVTTPVARKDVTNNVMVSGVLQ